MDNNINNNNNSILLNYVYVYTHKQENSTRISVTFSKLHNKE